VSAVLVRISLPQVRLVGLKYYSSTTCYMAFVLEMKHTPPKQNQSRSTLPRYWSTNHEPMAGAIQIRPPPEDPKAHSTFLDHLTKAQYRLSAQHPTNLISANHPCLFGVAISIV